MAQTGFTPLQIYSSPTTTNVPLAANLVAGELAINTADGKLFYKDASNVVQVLATKGGVGSSTTTQVLYNSSGLVVGSANLTFDGTKLTVGNILNSGLTASQAVFSDANKNLVSNAITGTGNVVMSASPTLSGTIAGTYTLGGTPTLGAVTLGGTVSGGGNQINNVIIGASTPLAGSFTSLGASGVISGRTTNGKVLGATNSSDADIGIYLSSGVAQVSVTGLLRTVIGGVTKSELTPTGLAVTGAISATGTVVVQPTTNVAAYRMLQSNNANFGYSVYTDSTNSFFNLARFSSGTDTTLLTLDASGNLGLGVTPSANSLSSSGYRGLEVGAVAGSGLYAGGGETYVWNNTYYNSGFKYANTAVASFYAQTAGAHKWSIAPSGTAGAAIAFTQAMTLDASGNLLVGTTAHASGAQNNNSFDYSPSLQCAIINHVSGTPSTYTYLSFGYSTSIIGSVAQSGTTGVLYNTTSDYRLKTVIGPVADAGNRIDSLQPVEYEWKADGARTRGFLAHQFQEVYAGSVTGEKDAVDEDGKPKYQAMQASSSEVIADLVAEIQSLRKRLTALEAK